MIGLVADIAALDSGRVSHLDGRRGLRDSVIDHLARMATTLCGEMMLAPDYGIGDVSSLFREVAGSTETIRAALEASIGRYEPRLHNVAVRVLHLADGVEPVIQFEILAHLRQGGRSVPIRFAATVDGDGHTDWA